MRLLNALKGVNTGRPPVWLMRQAGRYLPEYQALRAKHSLRELFFTPSLAADVALMPIKRFAFDAAILFSDITAIAPAMGFALDFCEGPEISPRATPSNWQKLKATPSLLDPIADAVLLTKQRLSVPLIGFCGAPFTIATYLAHDARTWMQSDPEGFRAFLDHICATCIQSLQLQIRAGADAVQIFDSWANVLSDEEFDAYSMPFLRKIADAVHVPVILFARGSGARAAKLAQIEGAAISIDTGQKMGDMRRHIKTPLQGNLDPDMLFRPLTEVRQSVRLLLDEMRGDSGFIVNLGHGVKPGTPVEAVSVVVQEIMSD